MDKYKELNHPFKKRVLSLASTLEMEKSDVLKLISQHSGVHIKTLQRVYSRKQENFTAKNLSDVANAITLLGIEKCSMEDITLPRELRPSVKKKFKLVK